MIPPLPIVLASGSPRRKQLLAKLVNSFEVEVSEVDEDELTVQDPWETARLLASAKAEAVAKARSANSNAGCIVIGGDTVVAVPCEGGYLQLAKPESTADAVRMLKLLSGRRHAVITAISVVTPTRTLCQDDTAYVSFRELSDFEIANYVETKEPMDKAGAYAIQGGANSFVSALEGDVETVIGLSTQVLQNLFAQLFGT